MNDILPITVILPIYNCADRLAAHLESLQEWLPSVEEVIVIDSGSVDGSADLARRKIAHPNVRHVVVPPGLYEAWNHAAAMANGEFCYFSTVGDVTSGVGLEHLLNVALEHNSDVIISPPRCINEDGTESSHRVFPIHSILQASLLEQPFKLKPWVSYLMATGFSIESFLGSSASNLYRGRCLKENPFPTDFGKAGDSAWLRKNALKYSFSITPRVCADFLLHQDHATRPHGEITGLLDRLTGLSETALRSYLTSPNQGGDDESKNELILLNAWREIAGTSPEKILDAVRHLEGVAATAEQQREYIEELKEHLDKRVTIIEDLKNECKRLRSTDRQVTKPNSWTERVCEAWNILFK
jgi:hypothetical protein